MAGRYWLMKSEPGVFSFDDLKASPNATTYWEGVRNYQARNYMRDDMKEKDLVLFYHSSCEKTGIPGIAEITKEAYPDHTAVRVSERRRRRVWRYVRLGTGQVVCAEGG